MWYLKYHSYFPFEQREIWWRHLICSAMVLSICSATHTSQGTARLTRGSSAPLRAPRWGRGVGTLHPGHCTKPHPHRSSLELGEQTTVRDHPRLSTAAHQKNVLPDGWRQNHICQAQIYREAASSLPMSREAAGSAMGWGTKRGAAGPCSHSPLAGPQPVCCLEIRHDVERKLQRHSAIQREDGVYVVSPRTLESWS